MLPNRQSGAAHTAHQGGCARAHVPSKPAWVRLCVLVSPCYHYHHYLTYCPSRARHAHRQAIMFFIILQKQRHLSNTKLLSDSSLTKPRPFEMYERVSRPGYNGPSLHSDSKWLHHLPGNEICAVWEWCARILRWLKNKEQEDYGISFGRAEYHYWNVRSLWHEKKRNLKELWQLKKKRIFKSVFGPADISIMSRCSVRSCAHRKSRDYKINARGVLGTIEWITTYHWLTTRVFSWGWICQ